MAIITDITSEMDLSKQEILFSSKTVPIHLDKLRKNIHKIHSAITGKNITSEAIIPNAPIPDFNKFKHPLTVPNASLIIPPTMGTQPFKANLSALVPILSADEETKF